MPIKKISRFLQSSVLPTDYFFGKQKNKKPNIGWCSVFPPTENGAAAVTYYHFRELQKSKRVNLFAIPLNGRIDKKLFPHTKFARLEDNFLDAIIFFCLGEEFEKFAKKTSAKKIAWQTVHFLPSEKESEKRLFEQLKLADNIFLTGKFAVNYYKEHGLKADYLPIGVDTSLFEPAKKKAGKIIFVNRLHERKGVLELLDAIPLVLGKNNKFFFEFNAPVDEFAGKKNEILEKISELKKHFPKNVSFSLEWKPFLELPNVFADAELLVFPSNNEGFGVPLIEAMSCNVPSIVVNKPPMNEIIKDGKDGIAIKLEKGKEFPSPKQIMNAIIQAKKSGTLDINALRKRAIKKFELKRIIAVLEKECLRALE